MKKTSIIQQLNIVKECRDLNLSLWRCPNFLFIIMGGATIFVMMVVYVIVSKFFEPEIVSLVVLIITGINIILSYIILRSFNKLAEVDIMKTEFVSVTSHELRTPLSALKWTIDLMMHDTNKNALSDEMKDHLAIIAKSNERMINLVNNMLDVSRIDAGKGLIIRKENLSLSDIVSKVVEELKPLADAMNIKILFNPNPDLPQISADRMRVSLVVQNLVANAIRYSKSEGEVKIELTKKGNHLMLAVIDSGIGIPKKEQKHIFQKFYRTTNARKHKTSGTGLGLFIAKAVVEELGGKIGFRSEENKGSTFWFTLPLNKKFNNKKI